MKRIVLALAVVLSALLGTSTTLVPSASAAVSHRCVPGSATSSGLCFYFLSSVKHLSVAEAVPLVNRSRKTATFQCSFTRTISRSVAWGASLSAEAKATLFGLLESKISATVSRTVTQTVSQAEAAGLSVRLKPGQSAVCERTYGYVTTRVRREEWHGTKGTSKILTTKVPSYLGVRLVD